MVSTIRKEQEDKLKIRRDEFILWFVGIMAISFAVFMAVGMKENNVAFWNIREAFLLSDYYLGMPIHKAVELIKALIGAVSFYFDTHSFQQSVEVLKNTVTYILDKPAVSYLDTEMLKKFKDSEDLNTQAAGYFYGIVIYFSFFLVFFGFLHKNLLPKVISKYIYKFLGSLTFDSLGKNIHEDMELEKGEFFKTFTEKFLKREFTITDIYERVDRLKYLKNFYIVLSGNDKYAESFLHIAQCFKSEREIMDLMKIIEGYLAPNGKPNLFDENIEKMSREEYKTFRAYNGKDCVYFSIDAMYYFLEDETKKFERLLDMRLLKGRSILAAYLIKHKEMLWNDAERVTKMLFGVNNKQDKLRHNVPLVQKKLDLMLQAVKEGDKEKWWKMFKARFKVVAIGYFRFILFREIILRYMNLPSGTMVVKIDDYTLRNIIDNYEIESLIDIVKNKNDGSSKSFENDILTNIFFYTYWYYSYVADELRVSEKIEDIWNTDYMQMLEDEERKQMINNYKESVKEVRKMIQKG